jgi:hypothetical protein
LNLDPSELPLGSEAQTTAQVQLLSGSTVVASQSTDVSPKALSGAVEALTNDDGANIWVDSESGYRHAFSEHHFYQPVGSDPIEDS